MGVVSSLLATSERKGTARDLGRCSRKALAEVVKPEYIAQLGAWPTATQLPIVYSEKYNIGFLGVRGADLMLNAWNSCEIALAAQPPKLNQ